MAIGSAREVDIRLSGLCVIVIVTFTCMPASALAQQGNMGGMDHEVAMPMDHTEDMPPASALKPVQGASVKILSPKAAQVFTSDGSPSNSNWSHEKLAAMFMLMWMAS